MEGTARRNGGLEWLLRQELRRDESLSTAAPWAGAWPPILAGGTRALILESTFTSLYDVIKTEHPWLPVSLLFDEETDYDVHVAGRTAYSLAGGAQPGRRAYYI